MVDPIITYVFAALFFVALLGSMLYLTFMTPPREGGEEASIGKSVVGGAGAQERSDVRETGEHATTDSDEVTEARDEEMYDPDEDDGDDPSAEGGHGETAEGAGEVTGDERTDAAAEGDDRAEADDGTGRTDDDSIDEKA